MSPAWASAADDIVHLPRLCQRFERAQDVGYARLPLLAADDGDRSMPDRSGAAGLAPRKDCNERHAECRGKMDEPRIHPDHKRRAPDKPGQPVERLSFGHAGIRDRRRDAHTARVLRLVPPRKQEQTAARR